MYELIIQSAMSKKSVYHVSPGTITLGRLKSSDIVFEHGSASRKHASIEFNPSTEQLILEDLGSTNGTYVNGKILNGEKALEHNDQIRIGVYIISVVNRKATNSFHVDPSQNSTTEGQSLEILIQAVDHFAVLLHDLSLQLYAIPDFSDALNKISDFILQMIDADDCQIVLEEDIESFLAEIKKKKALDKVVSKRLPVIYQDEEKVDGEVVEVSCILVPVLHYHDIPALIFVRNFGPDQADFEEHDLKLVVAASHQLALLIQRHKHQEELIHNANHDWITELPNRQYLMQQIATALARSKRNPDYHFAMFFIDINNFKIINDSLGHLVGDQMLKAFGQRLKGCVREIDAIARFGGDEFSILYDGIEDVTEILLIGQRIIDQMTEPYYINGKELVVNISVGVSYSSIGYETAEEVIRDADIAMYQAKDLDDYSIKIFDQSMHDQMVELLQLQTKLRTAYRRKEFLLNYQPVIDLNSGEVVGLEALIRWNSPDRGIVTPDQFINSMDSTGLQSSVEYWVMETACEQLSQINNVLERDYFVSINLSERQIRQPQLMENVADILRKNDLPSKNLWLEVTEQSNITNMEKAITIFQTFQSMGIRMCLDDFGTGYSTLSYLYTFPMDVMKIDKSFIHRVMEHDESAKIVRTIIGLAHNLRLKVVAEGVETKQQFDFLRSAQCDYVQGYWITKPLGMEDILSFLIHKPGW